MRSNCEIWNFGWAWHGEVSNLLGSLFSFLNPCRHSTNHHYLKKYWDIRWNCANWHGATCIQHISKKWQSHKKKQTCLKLKRYSTQRHKLHNDMAKLDWDLPPIGVPIKAAIPLLTIKSPNELVRRFIPKRCARIIDGRQEKEAKNLTIATLGEQFKRNFLIKFGRRNTYCKTKRSAVCS